MEKKDLILIIITITLLFVSFSSICVLTFFKQKKNFNNYKMNLFGKKTKVKLIKIKELETSKRFYSKEYFFLYELIDINNKRLSLYYIDDSYQLNKFYEIEHDGIVILEIKEVI